MTDKELLERAAMAAGLTHLFYNEGKTNAWHAGSRCYMTSAASHTPWNPLTDDGDALRLAVKLRLTNSLMFPDVAAVASEEWAKHGGEIDWYAATRRAITRAAAAIANPSRSSHQ